MSSRRKAYESKQGLVIEKDISDRFLDYVFNWDYKQYLALGGYGSGKSYNTAFKIILKLYSEKRKVLVVRNVYETIKESCFDLFTEILDDMGLLSDDTKRNKDGNKVVAKQSPLELRFPNGSRIIFKGLDKIQKLKSINGVTIIWIEEASEISFKAYKELLGRLRHPELSLHLLMTSNPVGKENWLFTRFFEMENPETGEKKIFMDEEKFYRLRTIVKNNIYYHHSTVDDNFYVSSEYVKTLNDIRNYDVDLYRVARLGRFGFNGRRVLPQFKVASSHKLVINAVRKIPDNLKFMGMDFGFEESYNALVKCAVDDKHKVLYIYKEYYKNHMTDDETLKDFKEMGLEFLNKPIIADSAEPKTIKFFRKSGIKMKKCRKFQGSRLENTKKIKRFRRIVCSPNCRNVIAELQNLTYAEDRDGNYIYDEFNIDPHTFKRKPKKLLGVYKAIEKTGKAEMLIRAEVLNGKSLKHAQRIEIDERIIFPRAIAI